MKSYVSKAMGAALKHPAQLNILVSKIPMVDAEPVMTILSRQRNPLFFWEPKPASVIKPMHYYIQLGNNVMMDEITFSQFRFQLNMENVNNYLKEVPVESGRC